MKKIIFVSIDEPRFWGFELNFSECVYFSNFLEDDNAIAFKERVKQDWPNSNLADPDGDYKYYIEFVELYIDETDEQNFKKLCEMMSAEPYRAPLNEEK